MLANFRQFAGDRPVKVAPLVTALIEPEVAERLRGKKATTATRSDEAASNKEACLADTR